MEESTAPSGRLTVEELSGNRNLQRGTEANKQTMFEKVISRKRIEKHLTALLSSVADTLFQTEAPINLPPHWYCSDARIDPSGAGTGAKAVQIVMAAEPTDDSPSVIATLPHLFLRVFTRDGMPYHWPVRWTS